MYNQVCNNQPYKRPKVPIDGIGARGVPDSYHIPRVLNSTFRYARFVKKLRQLEQEERIGREDNEQKQADRAVNNFFIHCQRKSLVNKVARKVELCLKSYDEDLQRKRDRLKDLLTQEEEDNIRKLVVQVQTANDVIWKQKMDRLQYLLDKRKKEHEDKYKDPPMPTTATPCMFKIRAKEAEEIQLYQMREKQAMKASERELDRMWCEVVMKGAEALAARIEIDEIERRAQDHECKQHSDRILEQRRREQREQRERLVQEQARIRANAEAAMREAAAQEAIEREKARKTNIEVAAQNQELIDVENQRKADKMAVEETWASLANLGLEEENDIKKFLRKKRMETNICNRKMIELREAFQNVDDESLLEAEAKRMQEVIDKRRCAYKLWSQKTNKEVREAMVEQIRQHRLDEEADKKKQKDESDYLRGMYHQMEAKHQYEMLEALEKRKQNQKDILEQVEESRKLKEKARQDEFEERRKASIAAQEYKEEMHRMLCRPFFTEEMHPFMKQMTKSTPLKLPMKCPCVTTRDWCAAEETGADGKTGNDKT